MFGHHGDGGADAAGTALAGLRVLRVGGAAVADSDVVIEDPDHRIRGRYGAHAGDVVLVRPDGYVGFVGRLSDHAAINRYRRAAGCPAHGSGTDHESRPSPVAAAASSGGS